MAVFTYYFDGSDATATGSSWTNKTNAEDGSTGTAATTTDYGGSQLKIEGTNAPASGGIISSARVRVYGRHYNNFDDLLVINTDGAAESILPYLQSGGTPEHDTTSNWSSWFNLTTPSGGWTWAKVQALEAAMTYDAGSAGSRDGSIHKIEIEVTTSGEILSTDLLETTFAAGVANYTRTHGTSAVKKKQPTVSHNTDSVKRKANTLSHTTNSNLKKANITRSHTSDSLLRKQVTRSHTTDSNKKKANNTLSHATSANKKKQTLASHTTDTFKTKRFTLTHTTDTLKRKQNTLTHSTDSFKRTQNTLAHTTDSFIRKTNTVSHDTNALLRKEISLSHSIDSLLRSQKTLSHSTDSLKRKDNTLSHSTDTVKRAQNTTTHTSDTLLRQQKAITHTTDSHAMSSTNLDQSHRQSTGQVFFGSAGVQRVAQRFTPSTSGRMNSWASAIGNGFFATDNLELKIYSNNAGEPGTLLATSANSAVGTNYAWADPLKMFTWTFDNSLILSSSTPYWAVLERTGSIDPDDTWGVRYDGDSGTYGTDNDLLYYNGTSWGSLGDVSDMWFYQYTLVPATDTETHSTDSLIRAQNTRSHTTDSLKTKAFERSHSTDANKKKTGSSSHSTDTLKKESKTLSHSTDSYLDPGVQTLTIAHSTDALLRKEASLSHTSDAFLRKQNTRNHTTDAIKRAQDTLTHSTDTLLRESSTLAHSTDTNKRKADNVVSHSTDSQLRKSNTVSHTTDANKKKADNTLAHSTDSYLHIPKLHTLQDDFTGTSLGSEWVATPGTGGSVDVDDRLEITSGPSFATATVEAVRYYDLTDSYAELEIVDLGDFDVDYVVGLELRNTVGRYLAWYVYNDELLATRYDGTTNNVYTAPYDKENHRWVRIREVSGTSYWETSSNGDVWVLRYSESTGVDVTSVKPLIGIQSFTEKLSILDNFNINANPNYPAQHSTNSLLRIAVETDHSTNSFLRTQTALTHSTDSLLRKDNTTSHATDANKRRATTASHSTDTIKRKVAETSHTTDSNKRKVNTLSHSTDSLQRTANTVVHTTDTLLRQSSTKTHTTDSFLRKAQTVSHSTDANKRVAGVVKTHTTDSNKRKATVVSHTTNANKKKTGTVSHTTGAKPHNVGRVDWVSPSNGATGISGSDPLVFIIPSARNPIHFQLHIDTANTFDTGNFVEYNTYDSQANWEYWNGSAWTAFPSGGVATTYIGNQARFTPSLSSGQYYRRIRGRVAL